MRLEGRVALITGGSSGIGQATARRLSTEGASVLVADIDEAGGAETVAAVTAAGGEARFVRCNVAEFAEVEAAVAQAVAVWGRLDIMFNNAGIGSYAPLLECEPDEYDRLVRVNQYGVYYGILAAGRAMRDSGRGGVIINTASVYGFLAVPGVIGYHAAKSAVVMMTKAAALELAPLGIRVVAIAPGMVDTPIIQSYKDAGVEQKIARKQMRRAIIAPEKIAAAVAMLASDDADAINGSVVMLDDGYAGFK